MPPSLPRSRTFPVRGRVYGAFDPYTGGPVLIVEAETLAQAEVRVASVAPLLRMQFSQQSSVAELDEVPVGAPTFYAPYFDRHEEEAVLTKLAPSSRFMH